MAASPDRHELFENHEYLNPLTIRVELDYDNLTELLDAPNRDVTHLGELAIASVNLPPEFDHEALQQHLTMQVDRICRKTDIDNRVVTPTTSWYRDNNRSDIISGYGSLIIPGIEAYTLESLDGKTIVVPSEASFRATINSWPHRDETDRVSLAEISLLHFSAEPNSQ